MPELPEVETTLRGIKPSLLQQKVTAIHLRHTHLRWPLPMEIKHKLIGHVLLDLSRRGKYLLFHFDNGTLILHLGMSGSLRLLSEPLPPQKHDHVELCFGNLSLRFTDPRRFGALLFTEEDPLTHPLLANMGPEPLTKSFDGNYLWQKARSKKVPIKSYIMNSAIVSGVGNIYAAEALFLAGIHPKKPAGKVSRSQYQALADSIKKVLQQAIKKGGTTLKDFMKSDGSPGYFSIELQVYGRENKPCVRCDAPLKLLRIGQRSTVYCAHCQK